MNILYIDDEYELLENIEMSLSPFMNDSDIFIKENSSKEFCNNLANGQYENVDIFVIDYSMPDINGIEVIKHIKKQYDGKPPFIIMYTGNARQIQGIDRALVNKFEIPVVEKPYIEQLLMNIIKVRESVA